MLTSHQGGRETMTSETPHTGARLARGARTTKLAPLPRGWPRAVVRSGLGRRSDGVDDLGGRPEGHAGGRPVGVADHALGGDDEDGAAGGAGRAEDPVGAPDLLVDVGEQREREPAVRVGEVVV